MRNKSILLINGFGAPLKTITRHLGDRYSGNSIYLSAPLGVLTIAAWCKQSLPEFNVQIIDANLCLHKYLNSSSRTNTTLDVFLEDLIVNIDCKPRYVGISMSSSSGHSVDIALANKIKNKWNDTCVIAGGVHATTFTNKIISNPAIDYVVRGPGDIAFIDLLNALEDECIEIKINGIISKNNNEDTLASQLESLDNIPPYPYELVDMEYIISNDTSSPISVLNQRVGMIQTSRGCPFKCSFCCAGRVHGRKIRYKSAERVANEIKFLHDKYGINTLSIVDDLFGRDKAYLYNIFNKLTKDNLKFSLIFPGGLSVQMTDEESIDILVENGLLSAFFAVESGSPEVLKNIIHKRVDLNKARRITEYAKSKGVFTGAYFVLGLPGETKEMMGKTLSFAKEMTLDWAYFFSAFPYPGTEITKKYLSNGSLDENSLIELWDNSTLMSGNRNFDTQEVTANELSEFLYNCNINVNFFSNWNMINQHYDKAIARFGKIIDRYPFHIIALTCRANCYFRLKQYKYANQDIDLAKYLMSNDKESQRMYLNYKTQIDGIMADILS